MTKLFKTEEWKEEDGDCLFFHFDNFEEVPDHLISTPDSSDFEKAEEYFGPNYWTHFIRLNWQDIMEQAKNDC